MTKREIMHLLRRVEAAKNAPSGISTPKEGASVDELMNVMNRQLAKTASNEQLSRISQAVELLQEASELFEASRKYSQSNQIVSLIEKIASKQVGHEEFVDEATKGLTPEKEVSNLKHHGTPFNLKDSFLDMEVEDLKVTDEWGEDSEKK